MAYVIKDADGQPVKHDGNDVFATDVVGAIKSINKDERSLVIVGSDETKDRDGDIIMVSGWNMDNFLKNPVFLYAHNHSGVPIGSATKVVRRKNPARLEFHEKFPSEGIYPFADMILALFQEKVLNASSVGFIPQKWEELQKDENDPNQFWPGRRFVKQELLELSACAVPSNPSALQVNSFVKSIMSKTLTEIKEMMDPKDRDLILEQLAVRSIEFVDETKAPMVQVPEQIENDEEFVTVKGEFEDKGSSGLPLADKATAWNGPVAKSNIAKWASSDNSGDKDKINWSKYGKGFAYSSGAGDFGNYKLPFANVFGGALKAVWSGVSAAMGAINGARGGADIGGDYDKVYSLLVGYYKRFDEKPPDKKSIEEENEDMEIKELLEKILVKMTGLGEQGVDVLNSIEAFDKELSGINAEVAEIKSFITNLTKDVEFDISVEEKEVEVIDEKSASDDKADDLYKETLSQTDNKETPAEEKADGLSAEEEEIIKQVIANLKNLNK